MSDKIEIIRSTRKTVSLEIRPDLRIIVRAPKRMRQSDIREFVKGKSEWIEEHLRLMRERIAAEKDRSAPPPFTAEELDALVTQAKKVLPERVAALARNLGVSIGRVTVRRQVSRWGSCSAKGNISLNCLLAACPPEIADYVIIHELCHRRYMNHSSAFWDEVARFCPDYLSRRKWLSEQGSKLIARRRSMK